MKGKQLQELIRRTPFTPFDIKTSETRVYTVDHPEFIAMSRDLTLVIYSTDDDRTVRIDVSNIVAIEQSNRPAAA